MFCYFLKGSGDEYLLLAEIDTDGPTDRYALTASSFAGSNCGGGARADAAALEPAWGSVAAGVSFSDIVARTMQGWPMGKALTPTTTPV